MKDIRVDILGIYTGHAQSIYALEKGIETNSFYSGSADGFVGHWNITSGNFENPVAKVNSNVYSLKKIADTKLLIGELSGVFTALDLHTKKILKTIQLSKKGLFDINYLALYHLILVAAGDGNLYILDADHFEIVQSIHLSNANLRSVEISPCGKSVVVGASDHNIYFLWYDKLLEVRQVINSHKNSVFSVIFKEGYKLLSGGRDAMLNEWIWDKTQIDGYGEWQINQSLPAHNYTINNICKSPDNLLFATASRDKTIKIWDSSNLKLLKVLDLAKFPAAHTHSINTLLWLDNEILLSAGDDKKIISWNISQTA